MSVANALSAAACASAAARLLGILRRREQRQLALRRVLAAWPTAVGPIPLRLQRFEILAGLRDHFARHARQLRHLQPVAAIRRPFAHSMQEHDAIAMLRRIEMHVHAGFDLVRQRRELEVVRGEQRERLHPRRDVPRHRPGERQPVERARATPDLIHQDQTARRRVVQDVRRFRHLDHEGRAAAREIVRRADAREDAIDRPDHRALRRHEAADVREDRDDRRLPHVRGLTAHVRPGDDQHAPARIEHQVVRHERRIRKSLDDRVAPGGDLQHGLCHELRLHPLQLAGALGETGERIELRQRRRPSSAAAPADR